MLEFQTKLLIVDDEPTTRTLLSQIFTGMGHDVRSGSDGFDALRQMRETVPDIILSDLNMPGMSGFEFLSVVRRRFPDIYVIATSGAYSGAVIPNGVAADAFYQKASGIKTLLKIIEDARNMRQGVQRQTFPEVPIWVSNNRIPCSRFTGLLISCPECLRSSSRRDETSTSQVRSMICEYCGASIKYSVAAIVGPLPEQHYQRELNDEMVKGRQAVLRID